MHLIWNDYLCIEASEIYLLLCVFIENCAVLTNYLVLLLDTPDRFFFPPISSVSRSTIYFHSGKRIRTKPWKETWLVNFHHHLISAKLLFMISCPIFSPAFTPVLPFFTYMCFSLTLLPTTHIFCPRDHLLQALMLYKLWFDNSSLITQEKTVPGSDSLRIYTQRWDAFPKIYFYLIIY